MQQPAPPVRPPVKTAAAPALPPRASSPTFSPSASHSHAKSNGNAAATQGARSHQPSRLSEKELEKFLINFVVEQTGYPPEIVELDADLEADLGIDSIKKAQLFGELESTSRCNLPRTCRWMISPRYGTCWQSL